METSAILEFYFRFRSRPVRRNLHVTIYQATEFRPNRSTCCGNMTSYLFLKMAAETAKYYFWFCICWCHCLQKVKVYQQTKIRPDISIGGWDRTISGFEIQTSAIDCNSTSGFDLDQFAVICMLFCIRLLNFVQIVAPTAEIWRHIHFSRWRPLPLNTTFSFVFLMSLPSEGQSLSANQILSKYHNWRLRYDYFRFRNTNVHHIGSLLPVSILTITL